MAQNPFNGVKNSDLFKLAQNYDPNFARLTARETALRLNDGYEAAAESAELNLTEITSAWYGVVMAMVLQKIDIAEVKDPLEGIVEEYRTEYGAYSRRLAIEALKPLSPKWRGLRDGDSVDQQIVRKPKVMERFFKINFDFYNSVTIQDYQTRLIFASADGMSEFVGGILAQLGNSYRLQCYTTTLQAINSAINPKNYPLQTSQIYAVDSWSTTPTEEELVNFLSILQNLAAEMDSTPATSAYNAGHFATAPSAADMTLLIRPEVLTAIRTQLTARAYNPGDLAIPFTTRTVINFGGLVPYKEEEHTTRLYPAYNAKTGEMIGYVTDASKDQVTPTYNSNGEITGYTDSTGSPVTVTAEDAAYFEDPNESVLAVLIQRGAIFRSIGSGPEMRTSPYNAAGNYQNYHFCLVNGGYHNDYNYNVIVISKTPAASV